LELTARIKRKLDATGKSLRRLARESGISPSTLCRVLTGRRELKVRELQSICTALKVEAWELLNPVQSAA
jgi:transcriptional regulator with XRE-family HTH domain